MSTNSEYIEISECNFLYTLKMSCGGNYIHWVFDIFGECISTPSEKAGFFIGLLSTAIWMYAQIPQILMNFRRKSVEGLSFIFILFLNFGDFCNLLGAILNNGLVTQFITAGWFVFVDVSLLIQYIWYNWIRKKCCPQKANEEYQHMNESVPVPSAAPLIAGFAAAASPSNPYEPPQLYGTILGWISALSYISSRMPQIITNFKRKRTEGLSIQFFWSAVLGNVTYALSIFLKDHHWSYIWQQFPWLLGSLGILFFDFTVLIQFLCYRKNNYVEETTQTTENTKIKHYISNQLY